MHLARDAGAEVAQKIDADAAHFLQEDQGEALAAAIVTFVGDTPA